jgi:hypothetical protein
MEQQQRQECALLSPFELERTSVHPDLERTEDAKLDLLHLGRFTTVKRPLLAPGVSSV